MEESKVVSILEEAQDKQYDLIGAVTKLASAVQAHPDIEYEPTGLLENDNPTYTPLDLDTEIRLMTSVVASAWDEAHNAKVTAENAYQRYDPDNLVYNSATNTGRDIATHDMLELDELHEQIYVDLYKLSEAMDQELGISPNSQDLSITLEPPRRKGFPTHVSSVF